MVSFWWAPNQAKTQSKMLRPTTRNVSPFCAITSWFWTRGGCKIGEYERWSWWQSFSIQTDMESRDRVIGAYLHWFPEPRIYPTFRFTSVPSSIQFKVKWIRQTSPPPPWDYVWIMYESLLYCWANEGMKVGVWSHNTCELRAKSGHVRGSESSVARLLNPCLLRKFWKVSSFRWCE